MGPAVVWLLPEHPTTHYGFMGELYALLMDRLSARLACWSVSWNPKWPAGATGYRMEIWNARGRHVGFWGPWSLRALARTLEALWQLEGFRPQVVQLSTLSWTRRLAQRWHRRFAAQVSSPFPRLGEQYTLLLPTTGIGPLQEVLPKHLTLFCSADSADEAAYTAELLALAGYSVQIVGYPRTATPLRSAATRFAGRIDLALGLSVQEIELCAQAAQALVQVGSEEGPILQWGRPWFCHEAHPLASQATGTYADPADLPILIGSTRWEAPTLEPEEFVERLVQVYTSTAKAS